MSTANRGQIRIIEAFLAMLIVFSAFTVSANLTAPQSSVSHDDLTLAGLLSLLKLDGDGSLGRYVADGNLTALRTALGLILPSGVRFNMTIYDEEMHQINAEPIANGILDTPRIVSVEYLCVSRNPVFHYYIIHLQLGVPA